MSQFVYDLVLSDFTLAIVLLISFGFITRWALIKGKYYQSYALGWLLGILVIIIIGALFGSTPDEVNESTAVATTVTTPERLNILQVFGAIFLGIVVSAIGMVTSALWRDNDLREALQVAGFTALFVVMIFLMFVASSPIRQTMAVFALTLIIIMLFGQIISKRTHPNDSSTTPPIHDGQAPPNTPSRQLRNRVNSIRENITTRK